MPMCRTRVQQGKNEGAECAARASIWTSIGDGFWPFSLPGVFSRAVSSQCATRKGLSVFVQVFFPAPWSANIRKCGKIIVGSSKNRVGENTTKRRHGISWELPM